MKRNEQEHKLQVACVRWFRLQHSAMADMLFAIPNGGQRNVIVATKLKAEGVTAGVPDLFLAVPSFIYSGMFIELKIAPNKPTPSQRQMIERLNDYGYFAIVCYSLDEFIEDVTDYLEKNGGELK